MCRLFITSGSSAVKFNLSLVMFVDFEVASTLSGVENNYNVFSTGNALSQSYFRGEISLGRAKKGGWKMQTVPGREETLGSSSCSSDMLF